MKPASIRRRKFNREFKIETVRLVRKRGVSERRRPGLMAIGLMANYLFGLRGAGALVLHRIGSDEPLGDQDTACGQL